MRSTSPCIWRIRGKEKRKEKNKRSDENRSERWNDKQRWNGLLPEANKRGRKSTNANQNNKYKN
jgi:hypothetical protein